MKKKRDDYLRGMVVIVAFFSFLIFVASQAAVSPYFSPGKYEFVRGASLDSASGSVLRGGYVCDVTALNGATCFGDVDGNGLVNSGDRGFIAASIGSEDYDDICLYDLNANGVISSSDRGFASANLGLCEPLPTYQNGQGLINGQPDDRFSGDVTSPAFCGDSDGLNLFVRGSVTHSAGGEDDTVIVTDSCADFDSVFEQGCFDEERYIFYESHSCVNFGGSGCGSGFCFEQPENCVDSDAGFEYGVFGTVSGVGANGNNYAVRDRCVGNSLYESYCVGNLPLLRRINCQDEGYSSCSNGLCA